MELTDAIALLQTPRARLAGNDMVRDRGHGFLEEQIAALLPTPTSRDHSGCNQRDDDSCLPGALLPTPAVNDMCAGKTPEQWDEWTDAMRAKHGNGNGHGPSLAIEAQRLLPTPTAQDAASSSGSNPAWGHGTTLTDAGREMALMGTPTAHPDNIRSPQQIRSSLTPGELVASHGSFGPYTATIQRWERVLGRPAPPPTEPGKGDRPRLSPRFVEWLMGLPDGWVTDPALGIPRAAQLKALGNGIVPQQMTLALRLLGVVP